MIIINFFEETLMLMERGDFDFTVDGKCSNCGQCCSSFLPITVEEIARIKKHIQKNGIKSKKHFIPLRKKSRDSICPFRDNERKKCTIYEVRPAICKDFRCDNPRNGEKAHIYLYRSKIMFVDMVETFFSEEK